MSEKKWGGRFSQKTDKLVEVFTSSIDIDRTLYKYDIEGSIAHSKMLAKQGIISKEDASMIAQGLERIQNEIEGGRFEFDDSLEDIHMHIENRLLQDIGDTASKLHTARSRNDQIALDIRMYLRSETIRIIAHLLKLEEVILSFADTHLDVILPGYTHLQRAQPVLLSHHMMAYHEMFLRDVNRFYDSFKRINVMPLGAAALAGTTFPIDRFYTAKLLKFPEVSENSIDSVSDRDFIIEFISAASICMMHISRISEEFILWSSSEFGFIELPDAFATGSSIMPQKKNPDVAELSRGKTGKVFGNLIAVLTLMKGLPMSYNRDMQEDKIPLFESVDTLKACLKIFEKMLPAIKVNTGTMLRATSTGFLNATDMADYLAVRGMPFRDAHACVGKAVAFALEKKKELHELTHEELKSFSSMINNDIFDILSPEQMIERRNIYGGTAFSSVQSAMNNAKGKLEKEKAALERLKKSIGES